MSPLPGAPCQRDLPAQHVNFYYGFCVRIFPTDLNRVVKIRNKLSADFVVDYLDTPQNPQLGVGCRLYTS